MDNDGNNQRRMSGEHWERFKEHWARVKEPIKQRWARVPDKRFEETFGHRDAMARELQEAYGITREDAERQLEAFMEENREFFELMGDVGSSEPAPPPSRRH